MMQAAAKGNKLNASDVAPMRFQDRLLAEGTRHLEAALGPASDREAAERAARERRGDLETRIVERSRLLADAPALQNSLRQVRGVLVWVTLIAIVLALILGAATARTSLVAGPETHINFFWALAGLLGLQTILLLVWLIAAIARCIRFFGRQSSDVNQATISLGALVVNVAQWLASKLHSEAHAIAAVRAVAGVFSRGSVGFWTFSAITHGFWMAFNVGCLVLVVLLLSARQYIFVWETTILSERHYIQLTDALATAPRAAGFITPSAEQVAKSQWPREDLADAVAAQESWAGLMVGALVIYGFGPRILLLGLSLSMRRRACREFRLDLALPEYTVLRPRLAPESRYLGVIEPDDSADDRPPAFEAGRHLESRPLGPPAILGIELDTRSFAWPPPVHGVAWTDLGIVEAGADQNRVVEQLRQSTSEPARLVIVCDLTITPDRGIARFVRQLREALHRSPILLLTAGQRLRERGYDAAAVGRRQQDWRQLARHAGLADDCVRELDLDHLTDAGRRALHDLVAPDDADTHDARARHLETAFKVIERTASDWFKRNTAPDLQQRTALHREIAALHGAESMQHSTMFHLPNIRDPQAIGEHLRDRAMHIRDLLPPRLKTSPKWLAAGAAAGALGCIATSALISPLAIAALPTWSAIGAGISLLMQPSGEKDVAKSDTPAPKDIADAVRAAVLYALLLELQGQDEAAITRVLNETLPVDSTDAMSNEHEVRDWLNQVRHRFDLALAREARP